MAGEILSISSEVRKALDDNKPVIALESTLIAHGFPYPQNFKLAIEMETQTRTAGVIPATTAILNGKIKVGLNREEIKLIALNKAVQKTSLRDIAPMIAKKANGGTTVAATMLIADLVGIKVFVTGGIGGVHRNAENTFDISADIAALAKYQIIVVCAGAKAVLDLPKTREALESKGVPVLGYQYDKFPAFYLRDSGMVVDYRVDDPVELGDMLLVQDQLGLSGGLLVTVPVPEKDQLDAGRFKTILAKLIRETDQHGITGKDVTPYLLKRLKEETKGESVKSNIALLKNNLAVGCAIVKSLRKFD